MVNQLLNSYTNCILLCDNKNIKADMKKMNILCIIASIILFTGCNTTKKEKEVSTKDPEMEDVDAMVDVTVPAKKVTDRDFSVTSENAYNDMFLDSLAMESYIANRQLSDKKIAV